MRPRLPRVRRLVDPVADGEIRPLQALAAADVERVGGGRRDGEDADRARRLVVEDRHPDAARVRRLPDAAVVRGDVEDVRVPGDSARGDGAPAAERADHPPAHLREERLGKRLRGGGAREEEAARRRRERETRRRRNGFTDTSGRRRSLAAPRRIPERLRFDKHAHRVHGRPSREPRGARGVSRARPGAGGGPARLPRRLRELRRRPRVGRRDAHRARREGRDRAPGEPRRGRRRVGAGR